MMPPSRPVRAAMTLVEMLVAMAATLILIAAVAQVFGAFGSAISGSRAAIGIEARLRTAAYRLRDDLAGVTVQMLPPRDPGQGEGYFEVIEGPRADADANGVDANGIEVLAADIDDVLLFTTRSNGTPFIGRGPAGTQFEGTVAEVAWFARPTVPATTPATYTLYRRQLLVMGSVGAAPFTTGTAAFSAFGGTWADYYSFPCDVSARLEGSTLVPNTLGDLTRRENRFMHGDGIANGAVFPYGFVVHQTASTSLAGDVLPTMSLGLIFDENSARRGEDIVLTNVLSFDVRVFDPAVPVSVTPAVPVSVTDPGRTALVPGDPGLVDASLSKSLVAAGGYVDLGHGVTSNAVLTGVTPPFGGNGAAKSQLVGSATTRRTYCTWSTHYEANGRDDSQPANSLVDEGTDGLDNDGNSLVDEGGEQETSPPYPYSLRGVEVRIRCYEPTSRQVRQVTVRQSFVLK